MSELLPDNVSSLASEQGLAKTMAEASYQVGIQAADITGHIEYISKRIEEQSELLTAVIESIDDMTRSNVEIAASALELQSEANAVTDRMSLAQAAIKRAVANAVAMVENPTDFANRRLTLMKALSRVASASSEFDQIARLRDSLVRRVMAIAEATARNREHCEDIFEEVTQVGEAEQTFKANSEHVAQMCLHLSDLSAELYYTIVASGVETADTPFINTVIDTARRVTQVLEDAVDSGEIDLDTLFDENYVQMPDIDPPKYTTRWLSLIERLIPPICEPVSMMTPDVVLCTITDRNGYMPVNNLRHAHPPTGDPIWNATYSRHRIRHRDRISERISKSTKPFLVMVFRRWLGDHTQVLKDVSAPVFIRGRLWGNVRMLILIKVETVDHIINRMDLNRAVMRLRGIEGEGGAEGDTRVDDGVVETPGTVVTLDPQKRDYPRRFCVQHGDRLVVIDNSHIELFVAKDRLVFIQTDDGRQFPIRSNLSELEEKLDSTQFMRCHRNYIVNIEHVAYLTKWFNRGYLLVLKGRLKTEVPVGRIFVKHLKKYIEFE